MIVFSGLLTLAKTVSISAKSIAKKRLSFLRSLQFDLLKSSDSRIILITPRKYFLGFLLENYLYDIERYCSFATFTTLPENFENLRARIIAHYHVIEKGLALRNTRLGFAPEIINTLFDLLNLYIEKDYPTYDEQFVAALKALESYCEFHSANGYDIQSILDKLNECLDRIPKCHISSSLKCGGGTLTVFKKDILENASKGFEYLARSRYSIRNFEKGSIDITLIIKAIEISQKTPSVCNRQSSFVYILSDEKAKHDALSCQNGNRGFGHLADKVLVVTANLRSFWSVEDRNQAFIDGGMFGMSLIYALHSLGLGTCTLNWSATKERDLALREVIPIKEEEIVIFMIAVGLLPEKLDIAFSQRKNTGSIVAII